MSSDISVAATRAFIGSGVGAFKVRIHHGSWSVGVVDRLGHSEHRCGHDALASRYEIVPDLNTSSAQQSSTAFLPPLLDAVRPLSRDQRRAPVIHAKTPSSSWLRLIASVNLPCSMRSRGRENPKSAISKGYSPEWKSRWRLVTIRVGKNQS